MYKMENCPIHTEAFDKEAPLVYSVYLYAGAGSFTCAFSVLMTYFRNKRLSMHPNGILIHLMFALCVFSFSYLLNGLSFFIKPDMFQTGSHCKSFGIPLTTCDLESTVNTFFTFSFLGWNFIWLYDLIKVFQQPMHTTNQLLPYYRIVVYVSAFMVLLGFFCFKDKLFTIGPTYTCFINLDTYKYAISGAELVYLILAGYTIYKYGRDSVIKRFKKTGNKLQSFFRIQKCYFFLYAFCWGLDAIFLSCGSPTTRQAYAIARSVEPTILSLPWIISIVNSTCPRISARECENCLFTNIQVKDPKLEDAGMNKKVMDDAMRNEIVEYLLKGIRRSIVSCSSSTKGFGDSEAGNTKKFIEAFHSPYTGCSKVMEGETPMFKKVNLIERKAIAKEAKREQVFKIPLGNSRMGKDAVLDDRESAYYHEDNRDIKFVSLGPKVFQNLRSLHSVDDNDIMSLFSLANLSCKKLKVVLQSGKGGSFFVVPENGKFLIKSINKGEYNVMKSILADLYVHYLTYPTSLINTIYGCYGLFLSEYDEIEPQYFVLMKNVLDINKELLPEGSEVICFDLKGSTAGRRSLPNPSVLLEGDKSLNGITFKDEDFLLSFGNVKVSTTQSKNILSQFERDSKFFSKFRLIDYSLLLFIINIPYNSYQEGNSLNTDTGNILLIERPVGKPGFLLEERGKTATSLYKVSDKKDIEALNEILTLCKKSKLQKEAEKTNSICTNGNEKGKKYIFNFPSLLATNSQCEGKSSFNLLDEKTAITAINEENQMFKKLSVKADIATPEAIEQLIFDSRKGRFYKRQLRFGIIDFLTVKNWMLYTFKKRLERLLKGVFQKNPSVAAPVEYANRFVNFMKQVYGP